MLQTQAGSRRGVRCRELVSYAPGGQITRGLPKFRYIEMRRSTCEDGVPTDFLLEEQFEPVE